MDKPNSCAGRARPHRWIVAALLVATALPASADTDAGALPAGSFFRECPDCPEMVVIPAGEFLMGSSPEESARDLAAVGFFERFLASQSAAEEQPQHRVRIGHQFALGVFPVTRHEFATFARETGYSPAGGCIFFDNHTYRNHRSGYWYAPGFGQTDIDPVVCVNWQDAQAYVAWLNKKLANTATTVGEGFYRLPSEAEWEYAARAGQRTARWWGDEIGQGRANCDGCGSFWDRRTTAPVGSFWANHFGVFDALGNVWEWTADCWNWNYDTAPSDGAPQTIGDIEERVIRGGSWTNSPWVIRSAHRARDIANARTNYIGFRVARTLP